VKESRIVVGNYSGLFGGNLGGSGKREGSLRVKG